jgi:hypothetical protein
VRISVFFPYPRIVSDTALSSNGLPLRLDPTATWLGYPYKVRLPPQLSSITLGAYTFSHVYGTWLTRVAPLRALSECPLVTWLTPGPRRVCLVFYVHFSSLLFPLSLGDSLLCQLSPSPSPCSTPFSPTRFTPFDLWTATARH